MRLVHLTGKASRPLHPKHLIKKNKLWYKSYLNVDDILLDIGCGSAVDSIRAAKLVKKVTGLDIDSTSLNSARKIVAAEKIKNIRFMLHNANKKLPFPNNNFDKVVCSDVLEHLEKRTYALNEIRRVLKKNGLLFLVTDNPNTSWKKLLRSHGLFSYADYDHRYEYPKEEIISILKSKKFIILSIGEVSYDTPFKGFIDLTGGISISIYKKLARWKRKKLKQNPQDTAGYKIVAQKI